MGKKSRKNNRDESNKSDASTASIKTSVEKGTGVQSIVGGGVTAGTAASLNSQAFEISTSSFVLETSLDIQPVPIQRRSLYSWCVRDRQGLVWVCSCTLFGLYGHKLHCVVLVASRRKGVMCQGRPAGRWGQRSSVQAQTARCCE